MSHNASLEVGRQTCLGCLMKNSSDLGNHCKLVTTGDRKKMYSEVNDCRLCLRGCALENII